MDANYVMDEKLGTATYDITKLRVGQKKMEPFLIGKVRNETLWLFLYDLTLGRLALVKLLGAYFKF